MSETQTPVTPNVDKLVDFREATFRFKKDKLENKRPNVTGQLPVPSAEGVIAILEKGGKEFKLLIDAAFDVVRGVAQEMVSSDENIKTLAELDMSKLSWEAIANMPEGDRRSSSIPEEQWKGFVEDYVAVMPAMTNKSVEAVTNATLVYVKKFAQFKTDKDTLKKLQAQLAIYMESKNAENFTDILELLNRRLETYLAADDVQALKANL